MPVVSGKSAYDLAVENGYVGSLQDWLASLSGWKPVDSDFAQGVVASINMSSQDADELDVISFQKLQDANIEDIGDTLIEKQLLTNI